MLKLFVKVVQLILDTLTVSIRTQCRREEAFAGLNVAADRRYRLGDNANCLIPVAGLHYIVANSGGRQEFQVGHPLLVLVHSFFDKC